MPDKLEDKKLLQMLINKTKLCKAFYSKSVKRNIKFNHEDIALVKRIKEKKIKTYKIFPYQETMIT